MDRPLILLSNDDGFSTPGIQQLRSALLRFADVVICAPATEQSATSHSISLNRPLRMYEASPGVFSVDGTPADCVYVALHSGERVVPRRPELVVSGMNHGLNLGNDTFYSGTVAAAREGALRGISALAVSASLDADLNAACSIAARLAQQMLALNTHETVLFNANFPPGKQWPVQATHLGNRIYGDGVHFRSDPRGGEYLWIGSGGVKHVGSENSDTGAFDSGVVGVTPLSLKLWASTHQSIAASMIESGDF